MAADALKSASITALDTQPINRPTAGEGTRGYVKNVSDFVTPTTAGLVDTTSKYKIARVSFKTQIKSMVLTADGALDSSTGLALDVGAYYSDSPYDGTPVAVQGTVISATAFATTLTGFRSSAVGPVEALSAFTVAKRNQPLWQALGLARDPGGFCDVVVAVHTAATTAVSNNLGVSINSAD